MRRRGESAVQLIALCTISLEPFGKEAVVISMQPLPCTGKFMFKYFPKMAHVLVITSIRDQEESIILFSFLLNVTKCFSFFLTISGRTACLKKQNIIVKLMLCK